MGYIIDNIDQSSLSKSEQWIHSIFIKNKTVRPVIPLGKYNKNTNYPKKNRYIKNV